MHEIVENQHSADDKLFFSGENLSNDDHNVNNVHIIDFDEAIDPNAEALSHAKQVIDQALINCVDHPGLLGSVEFIAAIKIVSIDQALWFEYRSKIKCMKPSGVPMADIDNMAVTQSVDGDKQDSAAAELIKLVMEQGLLLFDSQADKAFVSVAIKDVDHTLAIASKSFVEWLSFAYYMATKYGNQPGKSASESAIKQASFALSGIAKFDGDTESVYLRVADRNGGHYIFIGDEALQVIEVLPTGWRVTKNAPVRFWKPGSMQSLPLPIKGGDIELLWQFINIPAPVRILINLNTNSG